MEDFKIDLNTVIVEDQDLDTEDKTDNKTDKPDETKEPESKEDLNEDSTKEEEEKKTNEPNIEVSEEEQQEHEESIITEIRNHFGYEIEGDFSEDIEGLKKYTTEVARKIALEEFQQVFDSYPDVAEYMQYRLNNGDPSKFFETAQDVDFSKIELDDENELASKDVLRAILSKQGFNEEEIKDTIDDYEDTGILHKQAKRALPKLQELQTKERETLIQQKEAEKQKEIEESTKYWESIKSTIDSGKIRSINIPEADKKKFFDWMALPKENNMSQRDMDRQSLSPEDMLALEYLLFKKLDLSKLTVNRQTTKETEKLRSLFKSKGNNMKGASSTHKSKKTEQDGIGTILDYLPQV